MAKRGLEAFMNVFLMTLEFLGKKENAQHKKECEVKEIMADDVDSMTVFLRYCFLQSALSCTEIILA